MKTLIFCGLKSLCNCCIIFPSLSKYGETTVNAGILAMNVLKADKEAKANLMKDIKADAEEITPVVDNSKEGQEPTKEDEVAEAKAKISTLADIAASAANKLKRGV